MLVPIAATLDPITEGCLRRLVDVGYKVNLLYGSSDIVLARCGMATDAMRAGFEETLWIDSDQTFTPEDVERVREQPFVAGLYPKKGVPEFAGKFRDETVKFGKDGGLIEMIYVGMGFTHIHRDVYEKMERVLQLPVCGGGYDGKTIIPYFLPLLAPVPNSLPDYLSEDAAFPVAPDTPVLGSEWQWRPIVEYEKGDKVMALDEKSPPNSSRRFAIATVEGVIRRSLPLWRIVTDEHEFITTSEHPWLSKRGWRRKAGRPIAGTAELKHPATWNWTPTEQLKVGDVLAAVAPKFANPDTTSHDYASGYVQGLFQSDGTMNKETGKGCVRMKDMAPLDRLASFLGVIGVRCTRMPSRHDGNPKHATLHGVGVFNKAAAAKLVSLLEYTALPNRNFSAGYLAGMYDGDGSQHAMVFIHNTKAWKRARVIEAAAMLGLTFKDHPRHVWMSGADNVHAFWMSTLPVNSRRIFPIGQPGNDGIVRMKETRNRPVAVRAVENVGRIGDVVCLTTSTGTFIADGVASHNCYRAAQVGFPPMADTRLKIGHRGMYTYTWDDVVSRQKFESVDVSINNQPRAK